MPVLPEVGSRIVWPGRMAPWASASSIIARATRSLTEPVGLWLSSLAQMRTPGLGEMRFSSTSGVLPMACTMSPYLPPQGRVSRSGAPIASESVVPNQGAPQSHDRRFAEGLAALLSPVVRTRRRDQRRSLRLSAELVAVHGHLLLRR